MRWGGVIILLFVIYHILDLTTGTLNPAATRPPVRQRRRRLRPGALVRHALLHPGDRRPRLPPAARRVQRVPQPRPADPARRAPGPDRRAGLRRRCSAAGFLPVPFAVTHRIGDLTWTCYTRGRPDRRHQGARRPDRDALGHAAVRGQAGQPGQPPQAHGDRGRHRPGRRLRRRHAGRAGLPRASPSATRTRPRRAHSIAAQGGINAAKNYRNDGDSVYRLFYDTVKGGDFRSRESNVYRLAEVSASTSSTSASPRACRSPASTAACSTTAPSAACRCPRTFYARGQTGQQLLLGAYQALERQIAAGHRRDAHPARDARADRRRRPGPRHRRPRPGHRRDRAPTSPTRSCSPPAATATSSSSPPTPWAATSPRPGGRTARARYFANPCYTQIHPTCIPVSGDHQSKLTLMSESLRNDGRIWVPKSQGRRQAARGEIPEDERDYYLERIYPAFGNLVPRDIASRAAKNVCDEGRGVGPGGLRRLPRLRRRHRPARPQGRSRTSTATSSTCTQRITGEDPYEVPMRIYPAVHYTMGGLWVDYDLQSTIPGLFVIGEANFSDHGANRLGASALMQGLADGYFVLPNTIARLPGRRPVRARSTPTTRRSSRRAPTVEDRIDAAARRSTATAPSTRSTASSATSCGSTAAWSAPRTGCARRSTLIRGLREEFWQRRQGARHRRGAQPVAGEGRPGRRLLRARRADVHRRAAPRASPAAATSAPSSQTAGRRGAARRRRSSPTSRPGSAPATGEPPVLHKEDLTFEYVHLTQRSYK